MDNERFEKWPPIIFFSICGGLCLFFVYYFAFNIPPSSASDQYTRTYLAEVETIPEEVDTFVLKLDRQTRIQDRHFVYRGKDNNSIRIEVIIPALDPEIGYMYTVPLKKAEKGFDMSGKRFRLEHVRKGSVKLSRV